MFKASILLLLCIINVIAIPSKPRYGNKIQGYEGFHTYRILQRLSLGPLMSMDDAKDDEFVVKTKAGRVRGSTDKGKVNEKKVLKYLNIPYAESPTGDLRFEKPVEKKSWKGILEPINDKISCIQPKGLPDLIMKEDCLILNVWTPYPKPKNASVLIFIHGGAFIYGSSHEPRYRGANLVQMGDIIVVTLNYRLSALGFLTNAEAGIKGNLGLFDQRLALKWVKENIEAFGGNPDHITLCGESAGSVSVSAHTLSEESWPYFNRVILQSGNMLAYWGISSEEKEKRLSDRFLKRIKCNDSSDVLKCLKKSFDSEKLKEALSNKLGMFQPTVDGDFFKDHPQMLFQLGKVKQCPMIFGTMESEMFFLTYYLLSNHNKTAIIQKFNETLRNTFNYHHHYYEVAKKLYSPKCTPSYIEALRPLVDFLTDWSFTCPMKNEAYQRVLKFPRKDVFVFRYKYSSPVPHSYASGTFGYADHGNDLWSTFGIPFGNEKFPKEDKRLSLKMMAYFANFAKNGNPNIGKLHPPKGFKDIKLHKWPRHTKDGEEYLDIKGSDDFLVKAKLREIHCVFWSTPMYAMYRSPFFNIKG
ncbi:cholinesterase-like [Xenia sp. Carnegie-2017]|uniref:cholinesterase-like n=1 Tax=Xenia sp. Carnegie-2017 TaxID=2897299 RepID=UPI001F036AC0|nr:cholinesterase-like [Xenia sp. Carnegie-2017]